MLVVVVVLDVDIVLVMVVLVDVVVVVVTHPASNEAPTHPAGHGVSEQLLE